VTFVVYCPKDAELFFLRIYANKEYMLKMLIKLTDSFYFYADPFIKKTLPYSCVAESIAQCNLLIQTIYDNRLIYRANYHKRKGWDLGTFSPTKY